MSTLNAILNATECFAVRGKIMIDVIDSATGLTHIYRKTLEDCQREHGTEPVERMTIDEFCQSKAEAQDTPILWEETTEEQYYEMLDVLPPAMWVLDYFLVGEPWDHHALTGKPRYACFGKCGDQYVTANRPMTKKELATLLGYELK